MLDLVYKIQLFGKGIYYIILQIDWRFFLKRITNIIFLIFLCFSSICIGKNHDYPTSTPLVYSSFPNIFRPISSLFNRIFRKKQEVIYCPKADVTVLELDRFEYIIGKSEPVRVHIIATNPNSEVLTFYFHVSGGKIIGKGEKVIWDLSDVKPGTYTIIGVVDDGCGFLRKDPD